MKKSTLKTVAMSGLMLTSASFAFGQNMVSFTKLDTLVTGQSGQNANLYGTHRQAPYFFDNNNDGKLDVLIGGTDCDGRAPLGAWTTLAAVGKNNGNGTFTTDADMGIAPFTQYATCRAFDYNNDGNLDLIIQSGNDDAEKYVALYKNLGAAGGYKYEEVLEARDCFAQGSPDGRRLGSITIADYNHDGYQDVVIEGSDGARYVHLYKNNGGDGTFTWIDQPVTGAKEFQACSGGSVGWGDFNNDGWVDLMETGYADGDFEGHSYLIRIYKNLKNGTFEEVPLTIPGSRSGEVIWADFNSDGFMDIFETGYSDASGYVGSLNFGDGEGGFELSSVTLDPKTEQGSVFAVDINNDGLLDLVYDGACGRTVVCYQKASGNFEVQEPATSGLYENINDDLSYRQVRDGGMSLGDGNGDGAIDVVITGYDGKYYACPTNIFFNNLGESVPVNAAPSVPAGLAASFTGDTVSISWNYAEDDITPVDAISYNLFVKNTDNGKIFKLFPSDLATGKLQFTKGLTTMLYPNEYKMALADGNYQIGVQSVDQGWATSTFSTINFSKNGSDIKPVTVAAKVKAVNGTIFVESEKTSAVVVSDLAGKVVKNAVTNETISGLATGLYFVTVDGKTSKVVLK